MASASTLSINLGTPTVFISHPGSVAEKMFSHKRRSGDGFCRYIAEIWRKVVFSKVFVAFLASVASGNTRKVRRGRSQALFEAESSGERRKIASYVFLCLRFASILGLSALSRSLRGPICFRFTALNKNAFNCNASRNQLPVSCSQFSPASVL